MKYTPCTSGKRVRERDYAKRIVFSQKDFEQPGHLLQVVTIPPKTKQRAHVHKRQTEVYVILSGKARVFLNGKAFSAQPGDAFLCNPGDTHYLWNRSSRDFTLAVFKINLPAQNDTIWLEKEHPKK